MLKLFFSISIWLLLLLPVRGELELLRVVYIQSFFACIAWFLLVLSHDCCFSAVIRVAKQIVIFRHVTLFYKNKNKKLIQILIYSQNLYYI